MQRQYKKAVSTLLALAMVIGLFAAMPMTASAMTAKELGTYINGFDPGPNSDGKLWAYSISGRSGIVPISETTKVIYVSGTVTGATNELELNIDADLKVVWMADYSGSIGGSWLIELTGGGTFEIAGGSIIVN